MDMVTQEMIHHPAMEYAGHRQHGTDQACALACLEPCHRFKDKRSRGGPPQALTREVSMPHAPT